MWFESSVFRDDKYRGEIEVPVEVEATVVPYKDPFATGDSPTEYDVKIKSVIIHDSREYDDGEDIVDRIDNDDLDYFEEMAIEEYKNGQ